MKGLFSPDERTAERTSRDAAFAALLARHGDAVYSIARNMCASSSEAEELTKRTFVCAYREIASMRASAIFRLWLYGTAIKLALAARKRRGRSAASSLEQFLTMDERNRLTAAAGEWPDLADPALESRDFAEPLRKVLDRLDDDVRAAFVLCDLAELPTIEAAIILQTSPEEIRQSVHGARLVLRGVLDGLFKQRA